MILRFDSHAAEVPRTPTPARARVVQELMGGRFGEMSINLGMTVLERAPQRHQG